MSANNVKICDEEGINIECCPKLIPNFKKKFTLKSKAQNSASLKKLQS